MPRVDGDGVFIRPLLRAAARFALSVVGMGRNEERVLGSQVKESREVERHLELMLVAVALAVGLRGRSAGKEGPCVLPAALRPVGMVGAGTQRQVVLAFHLERRLPGVLVASRSHLLAHRRAAFLPPKAAHRVHHLPSWLVAHAAEQHHRVGIAQAHAIELSAIVLSGIGCRLGAAIPVVHESRFYSYVEHLLLVAVGHARALFLFALALVGLHVSHCLHGQPFQQQVLAQRLATVHHHLQRFSVPEQPTVLDAHARQLLNQVQQTVAVLQLEGFRIEHHRVAAHVEASLTSRHLHLLQQHLAGLQQYVADADGVAAIASHQSDRALLVAEEVGANGDARHVRATVLEASQRVGLQDLAEGANIWNHFLYAHLGTVQRFTGFSIKHSALEDVGLCGLCAGKKAQQGQDAEHSASEIVECHKKRIV